MYRYLLAVLFWLGSQCLVAQDFKLIDSQVLAMDISGSDMARISEALTTPFDTPLEKTRAIFRWVAENMRYDVKRLYQPNRTTRVKARSMAEAEALMEQKRLKKVSEAFRSRKGVCEDYSAIFAELCLHAGIEATTIVGLARDHRKPHAMRKNEGHAWNAVKLDSIWKLIDCTWAAGYVNNGRYTKKFASGYFLTDPKLFILDHYPDEKEWQLMSSNISINQFMAQPLATYAHRNFQLVNFSRSPQNRGGNKVIELEFEELPKGFLVTNANGKPIKCEQVTQGKKTTFSFNANSNRRILILGKTNERSSQYLFIAEYQL